jgi:hypothetical protein
MCVSVIGKGMAVSFAFFFSFIVGILKISAELDIAPEVEWDPCKSTGVRDALADPETYMDLDFLMYPFAPPSCVKIPNERFSKPWQNRPNHSRREDLRCWCDVCQVNDSRSTLHGMGYAACSFASDLREPSNRPCIPLLPDFVQIISWVGKPKTEIHVDASMWKNVTHLNITSLDFSLNTIEKVEPDAFRNLTEVTCVNLDFNLQLSSLVLEEILKWPKLQRLSL